MIDFRLWKNSFSLPPRYILITSLSTYHFLKSQNLVASWKQDNDWVDHWQKALNILSILLCVSSPVAQGHSNNQIWGGKSVFLLKIVKQDLESFFFSFIFTTDCSMQAGIPLCQGSSGCQYLVVFVPGTELFFKKSGTLIITNALYNCSLWDMQEFKQFSLAIKRTSRPK